MDIIKKSVNMVLLTLIGCMLRVYGQERAERFLEYSIDSMLMQSDILYPDSLFGKIEGICRDIVNDLDVINANDNLQMEWVHSSDYLINQFLMLHTMVDRMFSSADESRMYLPEDIQYLLSIIEYVEVKCKKLSDNTHDSSKQEQLLYLQLTLMQSKIKVEHLLSNNHETILC